MAATGLELAQEQPYRPLLPAGVLGEDVARLQAEGYITDEFDCSDWNSESDFHQEVARRLAFPDYYGRNLDAFNDCMSVIEVPDSGGRAIVFRRFDLFARREPSVVHHILDILALSSWRFLLVGRRLLTLAQSDDARIEFEPVGAHPAMWNPREWLNKNRGL